MGEFISKNSELVSEPTPIFQKKERELQEQVIVTSTELQAAIEGLTSHFGVIAGEHAHAFIRGYVDLLQNLSDLSDDINVVDILAAIANNMENEVTDVLTVYQQEKDQPLEEL